jgi:hypothetical protein
VWLSTAEKPDASKDGRYQVTVRLEFFKESSVHPGIFWKRPDVEDIPGSFHKQAVIYVEKPDITRASLEWKAARTAQKWDVARAAASVASRDSEDDDA